MIKADLKKAKWLPVESVFVRNNHGIVDGALIAKWQIEENGDYGDGFYLGCWTEYGDVIPEAPSGDWYVLVDGERIVLKSTNKGLHAIPFIRNGKKSVSWKFSPGDFKGFAFRFTDYRDSWSGHPHSVRTAYGYTD